MDIQVESQGNCRIVHITGKITFEYCPVLQSRLDSVVDEGVREVVIDFKEVPFIDSSGVGEVLRLFKRMKESGGEVILANPNQKLRDLFSMYRFDQFMKIRLESDQDADQ
jgi:anti-sigma B factor antagonist